MDNAQATVNILNDECITLSKLSKSIKGKSILSNINATVNRGDVIALLGANAAGKTTLIETILGFNIPSDGEVLFNNAENAVNLSHQTKQTIGYVPQTEDLLSFLSIDVYLQSISTFYSEWNSELVTSLIDEWRLPHEQIIDSLSLGQKQMVSILSAVGHEPDILILDEPVSSLDPLSRRKFLKALIELQIRNNTTVIFSTHIITDVERIANRLWVMKNGKLVLDQSIDDAKDNSALSLEDLFLEINQ